MGKGLARAHRQYASPGKMGTLHFAHPTFLFCDLYYSGTYVDYSQYISLSWVDRL